MNHLPAVQAGIVKGGKIGIRRLPGNRIVTDGIEFDESDIEGIDKELVMQAVSHALILQFRLNPRHVAVLKTILPHQAHTVSFCVMAHLDGLKPQDVDAGAALSAFRSGGQEQETIPDFIDI